MMSKSYTILIAVLLAAFATAVKATDYGSSGDEKITVFRFLPGKDMFTLAGNEAELQRLYGLIDSHKAEIADGKLPVYVDGYCASLPTAKENLKTAFIRANRVKSELITRKGLKEADFVTANFARAYHNNKDMVVVTLRIPAQTAVELQPGQKQVAVSVKQREESPAKQQSAPATEQQPVSTSEPPSAELGQIYKFAVRTNLLYDALLLPTLGVEWRVNRDLGVKLDGSRSQWGDEHGKVQKVWLLNPEARWYLLRDKRFYAGVSGSYGEYNIYKYIAGNMFSKDTGYQGKMWGAGLTVGYQLSLCRSFSVDFNLGLGYTRFDYDSFGMTDGVRIYKEKDQTKNFWGPTQAGISLIWTIGGDK